MKLLTAIEDVKQTQKIHSAMLQTIQKQLQVAPRNDVGKLPDDVKLPLSSIEEVDSLEQHMKQDPSTEKVLVRDINSKIVTVIIHGNWLIYLKKLGG